MADIVHCLPHLFFRNNMRLLYGRQDLLPSVIADHQRLPGTHADLLQPIVIGGCMPDYVPDASCKGIVYLMSAVLSFSPSCPPLYTIYEAVYKL